MTDRNRKLSGNTANLPNRKEIDNSVFTRSHAEFLLSFSIDQPFKRLSKLVRVTGTRENLNLAGNLKFVFLKNTARQRCADLTPGIYFLLDGV
jgi:hypothetical protein